MADPIIYFKDVKKGFKKRNVLNELELVIYPGEIYGIIGMSGSGKTTLLKTLIGFWEPESGGVYYKTKSHSKYKSVFHNLDNVRSVFGFAPQNPSFYPKLTVEENLMHFGFLHKLPRREVKKNADNLLNLTELNNYRKMLAENLSGGMAKRLSIACSIIHNPDVLILDEPTSNLDPILRKHMWGIIRKINEQGTTIVMASHFLGELESLCHRIGILNNGKIVSSGTIEKLKDAYSKNEEIHLETYSGNYKDLLKNLVRNNIVPERNIVDGGHKIVIYSPDAERVLDSVVHFLKVDKERIMKLEVCKPSLSEVFESFIKK